MFSRDNLQLLFSSKDFIQLRSKIFGLTDENFIRIGSVLKKVKYGPIPILYTD